MAYKFNNSIYIYSIILKYRRWRIMNVLKIKQIKVSPCSIIVP